MRFALLALLTLLATPAFAQGWDHYDNSRYGYGVDIPPGYVGGGESDNGDGQVFGREASAQTLIVWGGLLVEEFETEVGQRMAWTTEEGWNIAYQATTPRWASYSAVQGSRILYQRMILLCDGGSYAAFRAEYSTRDAGDMDAVIEKLAQSLRGTGC